MRAHRAGAVGLFVRARLVTRSAPGRAVLRLGSAAGCRRMDKGWGGNELFARCAWAHTPAEAACVWSRRPAPRAMCLRGNRGRCGRELRRMKASCRFGATLADVGHSLGRAEREDQKTAQDGPHWASLTARSLRGKRARVRVQPTCQLDTVADWFLPGGDGRNSSSLVRKCQSARCVEMRSKPRNGSAITCGNTLCRGIDTRSERPSVQGARSAALSVSFGGTTFLRHTPPI